MAEPDADNPESRENGAEKVHDRDDDAGRNDQCLQDATADERPARPPRRGRAARARRHGQHQAGYARPACRRVLNRQGDRDREPDHDRLHDQHRGAEPLHPASPCSPQPTASAGPGAGSPRSDRVSKSRASPAVITDPVISTAAVPGQPPPAPPASASSATATPLSIASSILGTAPTRSGPKTAAAISASFPGSPHPAHDFPVTTS